MVSWKRLSLVILLIVIFSGCIGNDIGTVIDKWNKVADKTKEIRGLEEQYLKTVEADDVIIESELGKNNPNYNRLISLLDKRQKMLDRERKLLEEESTLISELAGATVTLDGDAKKYAESMLINIRESHRYLVSALDNEYRAIESLKMNYKTFEEQYYRQYEKYKDAANSDVTNHGIYNDRANDAIKKLEALQ